MANFRKSFNFRSGVQVDNDNFVVTPLGLVGIGTTVPTNLLDVRGTTSVVGLTTTSDLYVSGVSTFNQVVIRDNIVLAGIVSATNFYGDGSGLTNIPTSQWVDTDVGLGYSSIYASGTVGIATTAPYYTLQVGSNPTVANRYGVGINSSGDIYSSGIVTASAYVGIGSGLTNLNASNVSIGTLNTNRLPSNITVSGNVTAATFSGTTFTGTTFIGSLTGTASTAQSLTGTPNITVGDITSSTLGVGTVTAGDISVTSITNTGSFTNGGSITNTNAITTKSLAASDSVTCVNSLASGISTITTLLHVGTGGLALSALNTGKIGIGTSVPTSELQIKKTSGTLVEVISDVGSARISIGQSVGIGKSTAVIKFGDTPNTLDIVNNDNGGDFNSVINGNGLFGSGRFSWINGYGNQELMFLTDSGKLGIGITNPSHNLHVVGTSTVTGNASFASDVDIEGTLTVNQFNSPSIEGNLDGNVFSAGISTFSTVAISTATFSDSIGIGTDNPSVGLDALNATGLFGSVGIGTTIFYGSELLGIYGSIMIPDGSIGIGTTSIDEAGAALQLHTPLIDLFDGHINLNQNSTVGFNTAEPKGVFDFGNVGSATTRPVMVVPNINNATITGIAQTPAGSIIFNTTTLKFQGYTGIAWTDFH